jgi:probable HAF family extracellular repeat protein
MPAVKWSAFLKPEKTSPAVRSLSGSSNTKASSGYPGDTVSFAFGISDSGQAVGSSRLCADTSIPLTAPNGTHAVLWQPDGSITDLGNLGGDTNNVATGINNAGVVVGNSLSSDGTIHPFLWNRSAGMQDLGAYPGAVATVAPCCHTLNDKGEVVGFYVDSNFNFSAFEWQDNTMVDLNALLPAGSPWYLLQALSINSAGQITGVGLVNGEIHAFLATPISGPAAARGITKSPMLPAKARVALFGRRH